jgi:hypothetical protein
VQIAQQYKSRSSTNSAVLQITQWYKERNSTNRAAIQIAQKYKSRSNKNHAEIPLEQQHKSRSSTNRATLRIAQQYKSRGNTKRAAVQIMQLIIRGFFSRLLLSPRVINLRSLIIKLRTFCINRHQITKIHPLNLKRIICPVTSIFEHKTRHLLSFSIDLYLCR